jgi:hypothetical protein
MKQMQKKAAVPQFIEDARSKGTPDKEITHQLLEAGWQMDIIQSAMKSYDAEQKQATHAIPPETFNWQKLLLNPYFWGGIVVLLLLGALFI